MKHIYRDFQEMYATIRGKVIEVKPTERKKPVHKKAEPKEEVKEEPKAAPKKTSRKKKEE